MNPQPEKQPEDLAIWRYGVISSLMHRDLGGLPLFKNLEILAGRLYPMPDGSQRSFSADTLRHWLYLFRREGLKGLSGRLRSGKGKSMLQKSFRMLYIPSVSLIRHAP